MLKDSVVSVPPYSSNKKAEDVVEETDVFFG
jgi:hypothetical protein